jgi:hypothetical protein
VHHYRQLLSVALELAASPDPSEAMLRRSMSTLYYAAFHRLMQLTADALAPMRSGDPVWSRAYRALDHAPTRAKVRTLAGQYDAFKSLGQVYDDLFRGRQTADYDPAPFSESQSSIVTLIREVVGAIQNLEKLTPSQRLEIAVELAFSRRTDDTAPKQKP